MLVEFWLGDGEEAEEEVYQFLEGGDAYLEVEDADEAEDVHREDEDPEDEGDQGTQLPDGEAYEEPSSDAKEERIEQRI